MPLASIEASLPFVDKFFENLLVVLNPILALILGAVYFFVLYALGYLAYKIFATILHVSLKVWEGWRVLEAVMENPKEVEGRLRVFLGQVYKGGQEAYQQL